MSMFSYEGKRVVVSGGGGAGMGAAAVEGLAEMGAEIHVLDLKEPPIKVASYQSADLRDPDAVAGRHRGHRRAHRRAVQLRGPSRGTLLGPRRHAGQLRRARHLASLVAPHMTNGGAICSISSTAGNAYLANMEKWMPLVETPDFASAKAWLEAHPEEIVGAYGQSKEALILWTMWAAPDFAKENIRLNCISPGPTDTPMMPAFESMAGPKLIDLFAQGLGRRSTPAEQAWPMIFLNSDAASYISGENLNTDGGTVSAIATGKIVLDFEAAMAAGD